MLTDFEKWHKYGGIYVARYRTWRTDNLPGVQKIGPQGVGERDVGMPRKVTPV